jgi:hypothetical protein
MYEALIRMAALVERRNSSRVMNGNESRVGIGRVLA